MKKYTILHTIETAGPGGAETVLLSLARDLDPDRFRSLVVLPDGSWLPQKLRALQVPTLIVESRAWYDPTLVRTLNRLARRENVDLIHSHLPDQNFFSCIAGFLSHRKTIVTYHGAPHGDQTCSLRASLKLGLVRRAAATVVVVSAYLEKLFASLGFPAQKLVRIYNGVDLDRFSIPPSPELRQQLGCADDARLVGMVANVRRSKGYEYFIRAARQVVDRMPQTRFVAVGQIDEVLARPLLALLEDLKLQDHFHFVGFYEDIAAVLQTFDVFVLSSVSEGFSLATVEAMAAGRPVIVTRSGGPEEIVEEGRTGLIVAPGDPGALAAGICELLSDPTKAASLGKNARATVEDRFSLTKMVQRYEDLYLGCVSSV